jgi:hypothetical protein
VVKLLQRKLCDRVIISHNCTVLTLFDPNLCPRPELMPSLLIVGIFIILDIIGVKLVNFILKIMYFTIQNLIVLAKYNNSNNIHNNNGKVHKYKYFYYFGYGHHWTKTDSAKKNVKLVGFIFRIMYFTYCYGKKKSKT